MGRGKEWWEESYEMGNDREEGKWGKLAANVFEYIP